MTADITYTIPAKNRRNLALLMVVLIIAIVVLEGIFVARVPLIVFVGFGIYFYFSSLSSATLTADRLIVKPVLGRAKEFPLSGGAFEKRHFKGWVALIAFSRMEGTSISYTKAGGKPVMTVNGLYDMQDVESLFAEIERRQAALNS